MYNPKEAEEDSHALNIAILFFAACGVLLSIYFHYDSGLKYWLLKNFGEETVGKVVGYKDRRDNELTLSENFRENGRNILKNGHMWEQGDIIFVDIEPPGNASTTLSFLMTDKFAETLTTDSISVLYLPANPKIAYPTDAIEIFSIDSKILFWSLIALFVVGFLMYRATRKWAKYRNWLRRY